MASKKSKILAMALCASVMTGIYASPVMAAGQISGITLADGSTTLVANDQIFINGVELSGDAVKAAGGNFTQLTVTNGMGITGGVLTVGDTSIDSTNGNTVVGGTLTATGLASLNGGLTVNGAASLKDGLNVSGGATVNGKLTAADGLEVTNNGIKVEEGGLTVVQGNTDIQDGLNVSGGATVDRLGVTNNATVGGTLEVTGETTLAGLTAGATTVDRLDVTNNATVGGTLEVTGETTLAGLTAGATTVDSLEVAKGIEAANGKFQLTEAGVLTVNGEAAFTKGVTVQNGLSVTGGASVDGNFAVTNGGLSVSGGESVLNGGLTVNNGDTKLNGKLDVGAGNFKVDTAGNTEFNGNLNIGHDAFEVTAADGSFSAARDKFNVFADGSFNAASENFKVSADGVINADSLYLQTYGGGTLEVGEALQALTDAKLPDKVGGIERNPAGAGDPGDGTTTIEGMAKFDSEGMTIGNTVVTDGAITTNTINAGDTIINNAGMTVGDTVVADSKITVGAADDQTIIEGGAITAKSLMLDGKDVGATIAGIERETITDEFDNEVSTTTIEGALKVSDNGLISNADGSFTVDSNGGLVAGGGTFAADMTGIKMSAPVQMTLQGGFNYKGQSVIDLGSTISDIDDRLDGLEYKTQNINGSEGTTAGGDSVIDVPATDPGHTGINGDVTVGGDITAGGTITTGDTTIDGSGINTGNGNFTGDVDITGDITAGTGNIGGIDMAGGTINTGDTTIDGEGIDTGSGEFTGNVTVGGDINAGTGNIGGIDMAGGTITTGDTTIDGEGMTVGEGTDIKDGNITVKGDEGKVEIGKGDVAIFDENGEKVTSIQHNYDEINRVEEKFDGEVNRLDNRITKVEDRIDKVGAMSAAIANLRTMGYDPAAPTEIAVGVGQYRSETGVALGMFHYPNKDFMLSLSVSTSGDEVMGGIGATWKFGRKSPEKVLAAEKEKAAKAKLAKAEAMKKAAKEAKIKAQQERHAKLAAERAAQAEAAK